jgi:hypothetical protein
MGAAAGLLAVAGTLWFLTLKIGKFIAIYPTISACTQAGSRQWSDEPSP